MPETNPRFLGGTRGIIFSGSTPMKNPHPPKKRPDEIRRDPLTEIVMSAEDWAEFGDGVKLFNAGKFWHAHEAWEQVWKRHREDERLFFQGLIQLAAAYHQLMTKASHRGLMNNFDKAYEKLLVFRPGYLGVFITPLLKFIEEGKKEAVRLGPGEMQGFNQNLIPKMQFRKPENPDLLLEIRSLVKPAGFMEGVTLFNEGYHWEAHEAWEDVWRDQEGDARTFVQAFVQMAAAYSFMKLRRPASATYLLEKAIEKFREFEHLDCGIALRELADAMQRLLETIGPQPAQGGASVKPAEAPKIRLTQE